MKNPQDVIYGPMITEKSTIQNERKGVYCFKVNVAANKIEIADAIESLFEKVKVASVRTARFQGKTKRMGRFLGRRPDWKKAWVTLAEDSKQLEFYEGA